MNDSSFASGNTSEGTGGGIIDFEVFFGATNGVNVYNNSSDDILQF